MAISSGSSSPQQIDLVGLLTAGQKFGEQTAAALSELDISTGEVKAAGGEAKQAAKDKAAADAEAGVLIGNKKLAQEAEAKNIMAIFGTNSAASDSALRTLAARINADSDAVRESNLAIQKKMSVGIGDDLFEWIGNQFTLPTDVAIHNAKVDAVEADKSRLTELQNATKLQIAISEAADSGTSVAILAAQARGLAAKGIEDAAKWTFETQRAGISALQVRNTMNYQQLGVSFQLFSAENAQQQLQLSKAAGARDAERLALQKEVEGYKVRALKEDEDGKKLFVERYNSARATLNLPPSSWIEFKLLPKAQQDSWDKLMTDPNISQGRFAASPAESLALIKNLNIQPPGAGGVTANAIEDAYKTALKKNEAVWKTLGPDVQKAKVNEEFQSRLKSDAANVPEQGSLLSIGSLQSLMKISVLQEGVGKMFMEELKPLANDPTYNTKPRDFAATALKLVAEGKVDIPTAASQIALTFKAAAQDNAEVKLFKRFTVSGKLSEHYWSAIDTGFGLGSTTSVDWTSSASVENALTRMQVNKNHTSMGAGTLFR